MKNPQKLREQAKKLLERAEKIENEKVIKIGRLALKYAENDFADFDLSKFKEEIAKV